MRLSLSSLPMNSLLTDISTLIGDTVSKKKIEMLLNIAEDLPDIEADDLKVKEILYNLLSNAVKFTPEGGKIGMRAKKADFEIEVVVWDTGDGSTMPGAATSLRSPAGRVSSTNSLILPTAMSTFRPFSMAASHRLMRVSMSATFAGSDSAAVPLDSFHADT